MSRVSESARARAATVWGVTPAVLGTPPLPDAGSRPAHDVVPDPTRDPPFGTAWAEFEAVSAESLRAALRLDERLGVRGVAPDDAPHRLTPSRGALGVLWGLSGRSGAWNPPPGRRGPPAGSLCDNQQRSGSKRDRCQRGDPSTPPAQSLVAQTARSIPFSQSRDGRAQMGRQSIGIVGIALMVLGLLVSLVRRTRTAAPSGRSRKGQPSSARVHPPTARTPSTPNRAARPPRGSSTTASVTRTSRPPGAGVRLRPTSCPS